MADLALIWNPATSRADWSLAGADLAQDASLRSAVVISLFTERRAADDEALPDPRDTDRRGWWGDLALDGDAPDPIGSKLWLLLRAPATPETRRRAELYCREALAWLVADGVAESVTVETEWQGEARTTLAIRVVITRGGAEQRFDKANRQFGF